MKAALIAIALAALASQPRAVAASDPVIQVDYSNEGLSPSQWTMTLRPDGSGHFRSQMGKLVSTDPHEINTPGVDRDFQVSPEYAAKVFDIARRHNWFNESCESHMKVAFQGWKTLTYTGPQGQGACTFNYSKDKEMQSLGESVEAVAETIVEGERLEVLLQHDRLGLDDEMEFLTEAAGDGRAQQICAIRDILERLAQDDEVLERVRKRAKALLEHGTT
ncbi:MAG: hypothetical protein WBA18_17490 [Terracidiphilus sp.]